MAQNALIKITIDPSKGVATINGVKVALTDLAKAQKQVNEETEKGVEVNERSLAGLEKKRAALIAERKQLSTNTEEYDKRTISIQKVNLEIAEIVQNKERENAAVKGSFQWYEQEIAIRRRLQKTMVDNNAAVQAYEKEIIKLRAEQRALTTGTKLTGKGMQSMSSSAGLAGAAATEFGRAVGDAQYGIQGVSNNVQQLSALFTDLVQQEGSTVKATKLLISTLMGPAGILVAVSLVTTAIEYFVRKSKEAEDAVKDFNAEAILQGKTLEGLRREFLNSQSPMEKRLIILKSLATAEENLKKILDNKNLTEEEQVALADEYIRKVTLLEQKERELLLAKKEIEDSNKGLEISEESLQRKRDRRALLLNTQNANIARQREFELTSLEEEIALIEELLPTLNKLGAGLNYVANEREMLAKQASQRTNYLFLTPEQSQEQEKVLEANLNVYNSFIQKSKEIRAKNEIEILESERQYEIASLQQGENYYKAKKAINEYYDALISKTQDEINKERLDKERDFAKERRNLYLNEFLEKSQHAIKMADLEARLADKRLKEALKTEKEQLDSDIRIAESRIKVLKILATTSESSQQKLDEALILLDDLKKRRANIVEEEQDRLSVAIETFKTVSTALVDFMQSEAQREIDIETNKTNAINDQLRQRLANEQMSADQRDAINQQIARNEAALVEKENAINEKRFKQQKAFNLAMALINTYVAANMTLKDETIPNTFVRIAAMISVIATGLANVATISRQKFVAKALPSPRLSSQSSGGASTTTGPQFNLIGSTGENQLAAAIAGVQKEPVKAYVVSSEVSSAQEMERKAVASASI